MVTLSNKCEARLDPFILLLLLLLLLNAIELSLGGSVFLTAILKKNKKVIPISQ